MKHYPHHIGDFDRATRHLTRMERSVYRDLLDMYYDTEKPLPKELAVVCRKIIARSNEESTAVEQVLNEFFILTENGWFNSRCDSEIESYKANNSQKAIAGKASAAAKALKKQQMLNGNSTSVEQVLNVRCTDEEQTNNGTSTNHKPINQSTNKPLNTLSIESDGPQVEKALTVVSLVKTHGVDAQVAKDFLANRKAKKLPLTSTAFDGLCREFELAGVTVPEGIRIATENGWAGFKKAWMDNLQSESRIQKPQARKMPTPDNFASKDYGMGGAL